MPTAQPVIGGIDGLMRVHGRPFPFLRPNPAPAGPPVFVVKAATLLTWGDRWPRSRELLRT